MVMAVGPGSRFARTQPQWPKPGSTPSTRPTALEPLNSLVQVNSREAADVIAHPAALAGRAPVVPAVGTDSHNQLWLAALQLSIVNKHLVATLHVRRPWGRPEDPLRLLSACSFGCCAPGWPPQ